MRREKSLNDFKFGTFIGRFQWRRGKYGSESVKAYPLPVPNKPYSFCGR